jgi:hypothetical protein
VEWLCEVKVMAAFFAKALVWCCWRRLDERIKQEVRPTGRRLSAQRFAAVHRRATMGFYRIEGKLIV